MAEKVARSNRFVVQLWKLKRINGGEQGLVELLSAGDGGEVVLLLRISSWVMFVAHNYIRAHIKAAKIAAGSSDDGDIHEVPAAAEATAAAACLVMPVSTMRTDSNSGATTSALGLASCAAVIGSSISSMHGKSSSFSRMGKLYCADMTAGKVPHYAPAAAVDCARGLLQATAV